MDDATRDKLTANVARGAKFLDEAEPEWFRRITVADLRMSNPCRCVLGQLYGDYDSCAVREELMPASSRPDGFDKWSERHGFTFLRGPNTYESSDELEDIYRDVVKPAWAREIEARLVREVPGG